MAELFNGRKAHTLLELAQSIERMFAQHYSQSYWVIAEINKLNHYQQSGHCHPDLLQKENGLTVVEFKSVLWKNDYERINRLFLEQVKEPLKDGIKVLCRVTVGYTAKHGLSLRIADIDISYTLGDIEAERKATIERLHREGIFNLNKQKSHALLPRRVAIISVESSKGFADFQKILDAQQSRFAIFRMLFPALLQGDNAIDSIVSALDKIRRVQHRFDAVAIIRGGGGDVGLSCYNNYRLAHAVASFPIPVYTGIGHATNETVCELVSYSNGITPTKVAQQLLDQFERFERGVMTAQQHIIHRSQSLIATQNRELHLHSRILQKSASSSLMQEKQQLNFSSGELSRACKQLFALENTQLRIQSQRIPHAAGHQLATARQDIVHALIQLNLNTRHRQSSAFTQLHHLERMIALADPHNLLRKGYSISYIDGKAVQSIDQLKPGNRILTILADGSFESEIHTINT